MNQQMMPINIQENLTVEEGIINTMTKIIIMNHKIITLEAEVEDEEEDILEEEAIEEVGVKDIGGIGMIEVNKIRIHSINHTKIEIITMNNIINKIQENMKEAIEEEEGNIQNMKDNQRSNHLKQNMRRILKLKK